MTSTSFIDRLKARMTGVTSPAGAGGPRRIERTRDVIHNTNRWDKRVWKEARQTDSVDHLVNDLVIGDEHRGGSRGEFEPAPELIEGLFHSFYKANPVLEDKRRVERDLYPVLKILGEVQDHPQLKELQDLTVGDPVTSAMALNAMAEQVREIVGRVPPPPPPPQPKGQPKPKQEGGEQGGDQQGGEPGQEQGDGSGQGDGSEQDQDLTDGDGDEFDPDAQDDQAEADQAEADWEAEYDKALEDLELHRFASKALEAAQNDANELENLRKGIGLEDGEWTSMDPEERLAYAEQLRTPEMKALSEIVGQMKRFALGVKATRVNDVPHEAYDVEAGNVLTRVLKSQFALLGHQDTKYEFYRRYSQKELLQFKMRGTEDVGKGPVVICIDKSASMKGKPFMWAMGVAEALRRFAGVEDRDYSAMFFGKNNDRTRFEFPEGKGPFEKVMMFLGTQPNGGTEFDGVLTEALKKASTQFDTDGKGKADIVFITDGVASLTDEWIKEFNAERERVGVRLYSVYIGGASDMQHQTGPVGLLNRVSTVVIPVADLKPESVKHIFEKV